MPDPAHPAVVPDPAAASGNHDAGDATTSGRVEPGTPSVFASGARPATWNPAGGAWAGPTSELPVTATSLPRWSGKRTAVVAALVIGISSVGAVVAAAATPNGIAAPAESGRGAGGMQRDGAVGQQPGVPGQQVPGQQVPGQQGQTQPQLPGQQGQTQPQSPGQTSPGQQSLIPQDQHGGSGSADSASPLSVPGTN